MDNQICIPPEALISYRTFKDWSDRIAYQIFMLGSSPVKFNLELPIEDNRKFVETILRKVNFFYYGDDQLINYVDKNRKRNCSKIDIIATTCVIILNNFKIKYSELGKFFGVDHSTVIYYVKRHANYCISPDYKRKYINVLTHLQHERIIPAAEDKRHDPQQLVSTLLSRI